jgi:hypothetical protein
MTVSRSTKLLNRRKRSNDKVVAVDDGALMTATILLTVSYTVGVVLLVKGLFTDVGDSLKNTLLAGVTVLAATGMANILVSIFSS